MSVAGTEELYASILAATKQKKVVMVENDLYASRDSLSSQSSAN